MAAADRISAAQLVELLTEPQQQRRYIMLVGTQGAGKSTIAKAIRDRGFQRLSYDRLVKRNPWLALSDGKLEETYSQWRDKHLAKGSNIVDDNPNTLPSVRRQTLNKVRESGYSDIVLIHLDMPLALCLQQNRRRPRQSPDWLIERVWRQFNENGLPTAQEGEIFRISPTEIDGIYFFQRFAYAPLGEEPGPQASAQTSLWKKLKTSLQKWRRIFAG